MRRRAIIKPRLVNPQIVPLLYKIGIHHMEINDVIDCIRQKYDIHIYNSAAPFVSALKGNKVIYGFAIKRCSLRHGWNARTYIGQTSWLTNVYEAKRRAINIAVKWIVDHKLHEECLIKHISTNASSKRRRN